MTPSDQLSTRSIEMDSQYIRRVIKHEQAQDFQSAQILHLREQVTGRNTSEPAEVTARRAASSQAGNALYRPIEASNATPMERFLTLSPSIDPSGFLFRQRMQESGVQFGSYESMDKRAVLPRQWTEDEHLRAAVGTSSLQVQDGSRKSDNGGNHRPHDEKSQSPSKNG